MSDAPPSSGDDGVGHVVLEMTELNPPTPAADEEVGGADAAPLRAPLHRDRSDLPWTTSAVLTREERDKEFDRDMLRRAIADTGRWAYGTVSVEAWVLDDNTGRLIRPKKAFWFDPVAVRDGQDNEALLRLVDDAREDFVAPDPLAPGVGLAGALWSELSDGHPLTGGANMFGLGRRERGLNRTFSFGNTAFAEAIAPNRGVAWREVEPISNDPDQPFNLRLKVAVEAGIGLAAGVKFDFRGRQGLVVYMARGTTDIDKLKSETNEQYLLSAADVIGSIVCMREPRHRCVAERRAEREATMRRVRTKMVAFVRLGGSVLKQNLVDRKLVDVTAAPEPLDLESTTKKPCGHRLWTFLEKRSRMAPAKWRGANNEPPPPFTTKESLWTFVGCLVTLLALFQFSDAIEKRNPEYSLVTGPFGALMTLQYSLTAAPASQPRNILFGQAISLSIALLFNYTRTISANMKKALGTSLSIMAMARLGCTHPPAGAAALLFTGSDYNWGHMGIMLAGNVIATFFAVAINDLNVKRQYPTFWGFGYWQNKVFPSCKKKSKVS